LEHFAFLREFRCLRLFAFLVSFFLCSNFREIFIITLDYKPRYISDLVFVGGIAKEGIQVVIIELLVLYCLLLSSELLVICHLHKSPLFVSHVL
jgi:hypothetical protein